MTFVTGFACIRRRGVSGLPANVEVPSRRPGLSVDQLAVPGDHPLPAWEAIIEPDPLTDWDVGHELPIIGLSPRDAWLFLDGPTHGS